MKDCQSQGWLGQDEGCSRSWRQGARERVASGCRAVDLAESAWTTGRCMTAVVKLLGLVRQHRQHGVSGSGRTIQ